MVTKIADFFIQNIQVYICNSCQYEDIVYKNDNSPCIDIILEPHIDNFLCAQDVFGLLKIILFFSSIKTMEENNVTSIDRSLHGKTMCVIYN